MATEQDLMEKIVSLAKRRGFIFPSSEIYGGINGFWDYGPLGVELKRNIKDAWWHDVVRSRDNIVGLDCSIIMNPKVWEASGHVVNFNDPLVDCKQCKARFRADHVYLVGYSPTPVPPSLFEEVPAENRRLKREMEAELVKAISQADKIRIEREFDELMTVNDQRLRPVLQKTVSATTPQEAVAAARLTNRQAKQIGNLPVSYVFPLTVLKRPEGGVWSRAFPRPDCPACGVPEALTDARKFNMMFKTFVGAMEDSSAQAYLRPETAQGIFANYANVLDTSRLKIPFGIAQIGKAFRNEINPRNYTFRSREFEQMEIEFFCHPSEADKWYAYWRDARFKWYVDHGLKSDKLHLRDHEKDELAHYARACADVEYAFPFGLAELEGIANRTDFDLKAHADASGRDMTYFDDQTKERYVPYVIEPSGGVDRAALAFLCEAYEEDEAPDEKGNPQRRTVLRFHPRLAPIKVAVFPLVRKDGMPEKAHAIWEACREHFAAFYDEKGAVGRRYRRQDEAGTPFCVTVDGQTAQDGTVTVRDRDSMQQVRVPAEGVLAYVRERLHL
ncbi:MAG TPA: glycine--tRNA ligase [Phycisphaerae bacterium]|nr:glycine--tRNA ligase [Phycisphaerae bacterium]